MTSVALGEDRHGPRGISGFLSGFFQRAQDDPRNNHVKADELHYSAIQRLQQGDQVEQLRKGQRNVFQAASHHTVGPGLQTATMHAPRVLHRRLTGD